MKHLLCEIGKLKKNKPIHKLHNQPYQALPQSQAQLQLSPPVSPSIPTLQTLAAVAPPLPSACQAAIGGWTWLDNGIQDDSGTHLVDVPTLKIGKFDVQARGKVCLFEVNCQWPIHRHWHLCDTFSGGCPKASTVQTPFLYTNPTQRLNLWHSSPAKTKIDHVEIALGQFEGQWAPGQPQGFLRRAFAIDSETFLPKNPAGTRDSTPGCAPWHKLADLLRYLHRLAVGFMDVYGRYI